MLESNGLEYLNITLYENIRNSARLHPYSPAYSYFDKKYTYNSFLKKIDICAKAFISYGVKKGDIVSICMPNTPEAIISFYALNKIGAIANMIHPLSAENEMMYYLNKTKSTLLVCIDNSWDKMVNIIEKTNVKLSILVPINQSMKKIQSTMYYLFQGRKIKKQIKLNNAIYWKDFIKNGHKYLQQVDCVKNDNNDACILYSSGTTGEPKGVVLTNNNFNSLMKQTSIVRPKINNHDSVLVIMPIFHGFGLGMCVNYFLSIGSKVILVPQFNNKNFSKLLLKNKPNVVIGVPTLFESLSNKKINHDLSFIKFAISGGDSLPISLKEKFDKFLLEHNSRTRLVEGYGLTECLSASCLTPEDSQKKGTIGLPFKGNIFKIFDPNTLEEIKTNDIGEICISGPTVMKEYYGDADATRQTLRKHKDKKVWLHTGDLGYIDEDGYVYFVQRLKRMIVSSGYNIYPAQIEKVLNDNKYVSQSIVVGIPHPYKIQVAKAYVVLKENVQLTTKVKQSIKETLELGVAKYAIPKEIEYITDLPKTKIGKIDYRKLEKGVDKK